MKILVVYASKHGSTKGIAEFIGEKLRERGVETDVKEVGTAKNLETYDAFVIGSAVYMGHWMKEAKQFVTQNLTALTPRPVWLFSSGPVGNEKKDAKGRDLLEISKPTDLSELQTFLKPRGHKVFFGALQGKKLTGIIGFTYRMLQKSKTIRDSMPDGDFRDWKEIEAWADSIAEEVKTTK